MIRQINHYIILKYIQNPYFSLIIFLAYFLVLRSAVVYADMIGIEGDADGKLTAHYKNGIKVEIIQADIIAHD